jgi:lipoprotein-anchoring transpeptidase ErfK/SrfK
MAYHVDDPTLETPRNYTTTRDVTETSSQLASGSPAPALSHAPVNQPSTAPYKALSKYQIAALPEAKYNAVIPGLMPYDSRGITSGSQFAYTVATDIPIYGADRKTPVARFAANNFLLQPSIVVPVKFEGQWALVLTPARQELPSQDGGHAPAQTAGWVRASSLFKSHSLAQFVEISVSEQTLSIVNRDGVVVETFPAGVGTPNTPTPTDVTGYIQARYTDPAQGESVYPIQLTSLHATEADNPYVGTDGGLIGIHYNLASTGAVSHGCVRLAPPAIRAVTALPLGTLVLIVK